MPTWSGPSWRPWRTAPRWSGSSTCAPCTWARRRCWWRAKIAVSREQSAAALVSGIDTAERRVRAAVPIAELIYLEPDLYQESRADLADPAVRAARRSSPRRVRPARRPPQPPA